MMEPEVSVVMGVYNGGGQLDATIRSVLQQVDVNLEFIIVNDGSRDDTAKILDHFARNDQRIRIFNQANMGLTRALIAGCGKARGRFIARQDNGDISVPERLTTQLSALEQKHDAVLCSSHALFLGPRNEPLYTSWVDENTLNRPIDNFSEEIKGPAHHGSVLMRRDAYEAVGGYRENFYFAQDIDLWSRLIERGLHIVVPRILYHAKIDASSISGRHAPEQRQLAHLAARAACMRQTGKDEAEILQAAIQVRPRKQNAGKWGLASGCYFIGSCLAIKDHAGARDYLLKAIRYHPFHWKAWMKLAAITLRQYHQTRK